MGEQVTQRKEQIPEFEQPSIVNNGQITGDIVDALTMTSHSASDLAQRPSMETRKSSGSLIISRDCPEVELLDEEYDADDARAMSPRRSSDEVERMGDEARQALEEQARALQANLLEIVDRVESVKSEHEKLEGGNKFLQSYIGELMQTSKITSTGGKAKGRNRERK